MTRLVARILLACAIWIPMTDDSPTAADESPNTRRAAETSAPTWALAIHGGAGSDPERWEAGKRRARREGLRRALEAGREVLAGGGRAVDAVEQVVQVLEDDAHFNAGRGSVRTTEGRAELDASIMNGANAACGAVAGVGCVKNPISLARRVMTETEHVLLIGAGAEHFAREQQLPLVEPDYFLSGVAAEPNRDVAPGSAPPPPEPENGTEPPENGMGPPGHGTGRSGGGEDDPAAHFGTVGCVALDAEGNLAAGTSTGGTKQKLPGRVGDSPIVGAGTYAANGACAISGTGVGEEYIRHVVAYDIAAQMRYAGRSLEQAIEEIMQQRLRPGTGGVIGVSARGEIVMRYNTGGMSCGAADSTGRFETHLALPGGGGAVSAGESSP